MTNAPLNGADYCAVRRLSNGDDETLADVGQTCEQVPVESLPWLLAEGSIELVIPAASDGPMPPADEEAP
jgi:hypothetical protein